MAATVPPVQSRQINAGTGTSISLSFTSNNSAGNAIIVGHNNSGGTGDRVTDSRNTYTNDSEDNLSGGGPDGCGGIASAANIGAGANTVQVSGAGTEAGRGIVIAEYSGLDTTAPFDKTSFGSGFGTALNSGATATLSQADELIVVFGFAGNGTAGAFTAAGGTTKEQEVVGTRDAALADKTVAATTAVTGTMTAAGSSNWGCIVATYKGAAASGPTVAQEAGIFAAQAAGSLTGQVWN